MVAKNVGSGLKEKLVKIEQVFRVGIILGFQGKFLGKGVGVNFEYQGVLVLGDSNQGKVLIKISADSVCEFVNNGVSEEEESEGEKEYFDDSIEERFYKQFFVFEDSDSGDDFFIGKVRRIRKKEFGVYFSVKELKFFLKVLFKISIFEIFWDVRNDKYRLILEVRKFEFVFFYLLVGFKSFRRDFREQVSKNKVLDFLENEFLVKKQFIKSVYRGFESVKQTMQVFLYSFWEASRRRKEQQFKIVVFQGKKIIFDD